MDRVRWMDRSRVEVTEKFLVEREGEERGSASSTLVEEGREGGGEDRVMSERASSSFLPSNARPSQHTSRFSVGSINPK